MAVKQEDRGDLFIYSPSASFLQTAFASLITFLELFFNSLLVSNTNKNNGSFCLCKWVIAASSSLHLRAFNPTSHLLKPPQLYISAITKITWWIGVASPRHVCFGHHHKHVLSTQLRDL
ncbi:hypothetical protein BDZ45DRAFT_379 [Acephala macrosclerotiorum]|nr:hypothetical protein BDZ45DRAFT_379 [Acephala macrosclerotiorum]